MDCMYVSVILLSLGWTSISSKPLKVFIKGYNSRNLPDGGWTQWFNVDHPGGTGDYETIHSIIRYHGRGCDGIPCKKPIAIKATSIHWLSPFQEGDRVFISPRKGLTCTDHHQSNHRCADYRVRFYCPGMHTLCHSKNKTYHALPPTKLLTQKMTSTISDIPKAMQREQKKKNIENEVIINSKDVIKSESANAQAQVQKKTAWAETLLTDPLMKRQTSGVEDANSIFNRHLFWKNRQPDTYKKHKFVYKNHKSDSERSHQYFTWKNW